MYMYKCINLTFLSLEEKGITIKDLKLWSSMTTVNHFLFMTLFCDLLEIDCFAAINFANEM